MNHHLNKHHKSSEEEFIDALEKLAETLEANEKSDGIANAYRQPPPKPDPRPAPKVPKRQKPKQEFLLSALEDAAADIDQFMASKHLHSD